MEKKSLDKETLIKYVHDATEVEKNIYLIEKAKEEIEHKKWDTESYISEHCNTQAEAVYIFNLKNQGIDNYYIRNERTIFGKNTYVDKINYPNLKPLKEHFVYREPYFNETIHSEKLTYYYREEKDPDNCSYKMIHGFIGYLIGFVIGAIAAYICATICSLINLPILGYILAFLLFMALPLCFIGPSIRDKLRLRSENKRRLKKAKETQQYFIKCNAEQRILKEQAIEKEKNRVAKLNEEIDQQNKIIQQQNDLQIRNFDRIIAEKKLVLEKKLESYKEVVKELDNAIEKINIDLKPLYESRDKFYSVGYIPPDYRSIDCAFCFDQIFRNDLADNMREAISIYEERVFRGEVAKGIKNVVKTIESSSSALLGSLKSAIYSVDRSLSMIKSDLDYRFKCLDRQNRILIESNNNQIKTIEGKIEEQNLLIADNTNKINQSIASQKESYDNLSLETHLSRLALEAHNKNYETVMKYFDIT